jgi:hypothetical protein
LKQRHEARRDGGAGRTSPSETAAAGWAPLPLLSRCWVQPGRQATLEIVLRSSEHEEKVVAT